MCSSDLIWGDPQRVGKPAASDLRQRKASLPIVIGAAAESTAGAELRALLARSEPLSEDGVARGVALLAATDAEARTLELARNELARALASLERGAFDPVARDALRELAQFVVARES